MFKTLSPLAPAQNDEQAQVVSMKFGLDTRNGNIITSSLEGRSGDRKGRDVIFGDTPDSQSRLFRAGSAFVCCVARGRSCTAGR